MAVVGRAGRRRRRTMRWIWTRGSDEGERRRGKISAQGEWSRRGREGGGRLHHPLANTDEVVWRGVSPVATMPGEQGE